MRAWVCEERRGFQMMDLRSRKYLLALVALLLVLAGCKGESPTAPPPGSGPGNPPGTPPPVTGTSLTLTANNLSPLTNSTTTLSATVTVNGSPAPNGTAVEFGAAPLGTFQDTGTNTSIRTTTNGVATAVLTSATAGTTRVTAVAGSVVQQLDITFRVGTDPGPGTGNVTITSVTPGTTLAQGGEIITITGTGFGEPVRVFFNLGNNVLREAGVISVTPTTLQVIAPAVDLGTGQTLNATVEVIARAGTAQEGRASSSLPFVFRRPQLTPAIITVSPASGPIEGGTRVTIFGEAFEYPVQVFFGAAEAQIINVTFDQIIAVSPTGRDASPTGEQPTTGVVPIKVINIASNTQTTNSNPGFRYAPAMAITATGPSQGSAIGGTRIQIDGIGFDDPVTVTVGDGDSAVALQPVAVSGTRIIAVTPALAQPCNSSASGPITVTNINTGISASGGSFTFIPVDPVIISVTSGGPILPGSALTVLVADPGVGIFGTAFARFTVGGRSVVPTPAQITNGTGNQTFSVVVPSTGFVFPTIACTTAGGAAGTQLGPIEVPLVFNNVTTECPSDPFTITITPPGANACTQPPPVADVTAPATTTCPGLTVPAVPVAAGTSTGTITVANTGDTGASTLTVTPASNNPEFAVSGTTLSIPAGGTGNITVTFDPSAPGARTGNITLTTNDPLNPTIIVCVSGTGDEPPQAAVTSPATTTCPGLVIADTSTTATSTTGTIVVRNNAPTGSASLIVTPTSNDTEFAVSSTPITIGPQLNGNITVTFDPDTLGPRTATITLNTNDPLNQQIQVCTTGNGIP
jgi:hypothetical protein